MYGNDEKHPGLVGILERLRSKGMLSDSTYDYIGRN